VRTGATAAVEQYVTFCASCLVSGEPMNE
jgi:hypothetical protein